MTLAVLSLLWTRCWVGVGNLVITEPATLPVTLVMGTVVFSVLVNYCLDCIALKTSKDMNHLNTFLSSRIQWIQPLTRKGLNKQ